MIRYDKHLSVIEFARQIQARPHMYFFKLRFSNLADILWGYSANATHESVIPFHYFNYWIKWKLKKFGASYNWVIAILESCDHDEEKAFWKFYELLDEFVLLKPSRQLEAELCAENFAFYYALSNQNKSYKIIGVDNRWILEPAPYYVKLFEFDYCVHAYHFDRDWLVGEYDQNTYYCSFENMADCQNTYKNKFNLINWKIVDDDKINVDFAETISKCRNC